jgi:hypothetical protein
MSLMYPRTVSITRPAVQTGVGAIDAYSGLTPATETSVAASLPAQIEFKRERSAPDGNLPSGAYTRSGWLIFLPKRAAGPGVIKERDVATDDLGRRFHITAAEWDVLGYRLSTELLEA